MRFENTSKKESALKLTLGVSVILGNFGVIWGRLGSFCDIGGLRNAHGVFFA